MSRQMRLKADAQNTIGTLERALASGLRQLADVADVYAWGLRREFTAVRIACDARRAGGDEPMDRPRARAQAADLRRVAGDGR